MKKREIIIIALLIAFAGMFLLYNNLQGSASTDSGLNVVVSIDGEVYKSIPLTAKEETLPIETKYGKNLIKIHDGGVEMVDADCPDKLCKGFGFVNKPSDMIVCLPHHLMVEITETSN